MKNFFLKIFKKYFNSDLLITLPILAIASIIPIIKTYGKLNIGHDTLIPLVPQFSYKMGYQWNDISNGEYYSNNYFIWIFIFNIFTFIGLNVYQSAFTYQFIIFFLSSIGIYKIYNLFNKGNKLFGLLPAIFIIISPHYLDHHIYYLGTVGIIWIIYVIFKFIKYKVLTPLDIVGISICLGLIVDLPNPKYHFLLLIFAVFAVILSLTIRLLSLKDIIINAKKIFLLLIGSLYVSLPFIFFGYGFLHNTGIKINVKQSYQSSGYTLDYGLALISKMIRLFHTPSLNSKPAELIASPFFTLNYYLLPIVVLGLFPILCRFFDKRSKRIYAIYYILALFFLFLSKGANAPFGFVYEYLLNEYNALAFMRTTSGVVIFAAVFYVLIYGKIFQSIVELKINKIKIILIFLLVLLPIIVGYPIWSGQYFLNISTVNNYVDKNQYGLKIPSDYFKSSVFLKNIELDTKVDIYPYTSGYQNNTWGYYGFVLYPLLIDKPIISFDKRTSSGKIFSQTNSLYIYHDKSLEDNYSAKSFFHKPVRILFRSPKVDIYKKNDSDFLPHFYSKILNGADNKLIEYKKIDPAKYRVVVHHASIPFLLTFTENFHQLWKIYLTDIYSRQDELVMKNQLNSFYNQQSTSEYYQAHKENILNYINNGSLTTLGDMKVKKKNYFEYRDEKIVPFKSVYYYIDFISKNNKGTIQNNNLPQGHFYETLFFQELKLPHKMVNGYANGWTLDPKEICNNNPASCQINRDGSYDFEFIVEFLPQKLANISYIISSTVIISLILYHIMINIRQKLIDYKDEYHH